MKLLCHVAGTDRWWYKSPLQHSLTQKFNINLGWEISKIPDTRPKSQGTINSCNEIIETLAYQTRSTHSDSLHKKRNSTGQYFPSKDFILDRLGAGSVTVARVESDILVSGWPTISYFTVLSEQYQTVISSETKQLTTSIHILSK